LEEQTYLIFMKFTCSILCFMFNPLVLHLKWHYHTQGHLNFLLLYFRSVIVLHSHLSLWSVLVNFCDKHIKVHFLALWLFNCSNILLERLSFLHCIAFGNLLKMRWLHFCGSISGLSMLYHLSV
jgi:hypothetical protein